MEFRIVIPARYHSKRLPGKPLINLAGKPMIQHVYELALESGAETVVIATDNDRIAKAAKKFNAPVCMTSAEHKTGTDRIAEACNILEYDDEDIVIGLQCDEPLLPPQSIHQLANNLYVHDNVKVASICETIHSASTLFDPNTVKVILNHRHYALYFSRAPIPWDREHFRNCTENYSTLDKKLKDCYFRHVGLYAYCVKFLKNYTNWSEAPMENIECLEQLRILWYGARIHMCISKEFIPSGVDTSEDLKRVEKLMLEEKSKPSVN